MLSPMLELVRGSLLLRDSSEDDTQINEFARDKSTDEIQVEAQIEDRLMKLSDIIFENNNELVGTGRIMILKKGNSNREHHKKCDYDLNAEEQLLKQHENVYENINGEYRKKGGSQHPDGDRESNCLGSFRKSIGPTSGGSGSILDVLEEVIKVGQTMGYKMDGCASNIVEIIKIRGENESFQ
ncbi:hypothetical protein Tco_0672848 [Tanacetum coccineum]